MPSDLQAAFIRSTEKDCRLLNTSGSVTWEWFDSWASAIGLFFPQYAVNDVVRALFAVNVPYLVPILAFAPGEHFKVIGGKVVLFAPQEWRGTSCQSVTGQCVSAASMAERLNGYPAGTVTHIYVTSDGGANIQDIYQLVAHLAPHVEIVNNEVLALAALDSISEPVV